METIGSKPTGFLGILAGRLMNLIHSSQYKRIINQMICTDLDPSAQKTVLDTGCGGGLSVKLFSRVKGIHTVTGIDLSEDMVRLSEKVNKRGIAKGRVKIKQADVTELLFENSSFDIITAFDTVSFWPDHKTAGSEIFRTLKPGGTFFIINAYPKEGTRWHEFVKFKNDEEYKAYLTSFGLKEVKAVVKKGTIIVQGIKG